MTLAEPDGEVLGAEVDGDELAAELLHVDREDGRLHGRVERVLQAALGLRRPVHGQAGAGVVQRAEERDPENVVEVEVGQQRRGVHRCPERPHLPLQDVAERPQAGAQVDDERLVPLDVDHQARGVPPVAPVAIPRARARPPHAVERDVHRTRRYPAAAAVRSAPMKQRTINANGLDFACLVDGPDDGPLALCLHGFPDTAHTWRYLLPELAAAGFHAVAPFLRGYAPTSIPADGRYQIGALVQDITALHEALGGGPDAVIVGHDWGALATYGAVAHQPDRWHRAVTAAVPPTASIGMSLLHLRAAAEELVHVLLPLPAGRVGAAAR